MAEKKGAVGGEPGNPTAPVGRTPIKTVRPAAAFKGLAIKSVRPAAASKGLVPAVFPLERAMATVGSVALVAGQPSDAHGLNLPVLGG